MNNKTVLTLVALAALAGGAWAASTQNPPTNPPSNPPPQDQKPKDASNSVRPFDLQKLDTIVGLEVKGPKNDKVAKVDDLVVGSSGQIDYAVLSVGGVAGIGDSKKLLPWRDLQLTVTDKGGKPEAEARITMSEEQLKALRPFDPKSLPASAVSAGSTTGGTARPASDGGDGKAASAAMMTSSVVCAKQVDGHAVNGAGNDKIGEISDLALDLGAARVAFVVLDVGGTLGLGEKHFAVPWNALSFERDAKGDLSIHSNLSKEKLSGAPEFDDKRWPDMRSATWLGKLYGFYSVDPYWPHAMGEKPMGGK